MDEQVKPEKTIDCCVDVAVWDEVFGMDRESKRRLACVMLPPSGHAGVVRVHSWEAKLQPGYYRIHVRPKEFVDAQAVRDLKWQFSIGEQAHATSPFGDFEVPMGWMAGKALWIRIQVIDEPLRDDAHVHDDELEKGSWFCPWSPTRVCYYEPEEDPSRDSCIYCGMPEERK